MKQGGKHFKTKAKRSTTPQHIKQGETILKPNQQHQNK